MQGVQMCTLQSTRVLSNRHGDVIPHGVETAIVTSGRGQTHTGMVKCVHGTMVDRGHAGIYLYR